MLRKTLLSLLLVGASLSATEATKANVAKLYVATFNRAPDSAGLDYWVNTSGLDLEEISESFFEQPETQTLYPESTANRDFVNSVYQNLFNRAPDTAGWDYWENELNIGSFSKNRFIQAVIDGAQDTLEYGNDAKKLANKAQVGLAFADSGKEDVTEAKDIMAEVDDDDDSVEAAFSAYNIDASTIQGDITADTTLTLANSPYKLAGNKVKVKNGATLTIEAGVTIYGESTAYLIITKGSKIMAEGTASKPIIFTSEAAFNGAPAAAGQWGGVTVLGNAVTNEAESIRYEVDEADADFAYGGTDDTDNSGVLNHVKILNSGFAVAPDKEVNGLSLAGVGSATTVKNITIVDSGDDGIEIWGGSVNLDNISITGAQDDGFDVDSGYHGHVTNLTVTQTEPGAALIEMTNGGDATIQRTDWTLDGFTLTASANQKKEGGIYFKDLDVTGTFKNGTVDMTNSPAANLGAGLTNKEGVHAAAFENVTVKGSASVDVQANKKDGDTTDAGTSVLNDAFNTGKKNSYTSHP